MTISPKNITTPFKTPTKTGFFPSYSLERIAASSETFAWISSYQGTNSSTMQVKRDVSGDLKGRHVVILEDIFDTGNSLDFTYKHLLSKEPASLKIVTLLDKPAGRNPKVTLEADYVGFTIPHAFVVGYGLDYNEYYRNLPYVGILKPEVYTK